jgi:thiol-disulfide isomerase/thioredoxin
MMNASPYEADEVEVAWSGQETIALDPAPERVIVLGAFASTSVAFGMVARQAASLGETKGSFEVIYSYCIGELCYQIVESVPVLVRVVASVQTTSSAVPGSLGDADAFASPPAPWRWIAFAVAAMLIVPAVLLRRNGQVRVLLTAALVVAGGVTLGLGVSLDQHEQAQAVGAVLCTSCVGIETVQTLRARLSPSQAAAVEQLTAPIELLVFYAPWCRSCPYAEELVGLVAAHNGLVRYRLVNAEVERDLAAQHGVTRAGRTVVPAIVHLGTGKVLFGAEDLGNRLVSLLQEAP